MKKMKDSGIEWIGEIPEEWETIKVKYTSWLKGRIGWDGLKSTEYTESGPYLITGVNFNNGIIDWESCVHISEERFYQDSDIHIVEGDLLITKDGTIGKVAIAKNCPEKVSLNSGVLLIRNTSLFKYHDKYLYYVLLSEMFWKWYTLSQTGQSTIKHLYQEQFYDFEFTYPNIKEQTAIAASLDRQCTHIDNIIEKTKTSIEEYKKLKQAVITQAVTKGIRGKREMKDSGIDYLGEIPINWSLISISKAFNFIGGYAYKSELFCSKSSFQVVRIGNVRDDKLLLERNPVYIDSDYAKQSLSSKIKSNDILFSMTGTKGKKDYFYTVLIDNNLVSSKNLFVNQRVGCFRQNANICMKYYCYLLKVERIKDFIFIYETGTANQGNLGIETINRTKLFLPPIDEQQEIAAYLDQKCSEIEAIITKKQQFITEMENYKKSLIFECVTGKREVSV